MKLTLKKSVLVVLGAMLMTTIMLSDLATHMYQSPLTPISFSTLDLNTFDIDIEPQWPPGLKPDEFYLYQLRWYTILINIKGDADGLSMKLVLNFSAKNPGQSNVYKDMPLNSIEVLLSEYPNNPAQEPSNIILIQKISSYAYLNGNSSAYWWNYPNEVTLYYNLTFRVHPTFPKNKVLEIDTGIYSDTS